MAEQLGLTFAQYCALEPASCTSPMTSTSGSCGWRRNRTDNPIGHGTMSPRTTLAVPRGPEGVARCGNGLLRADGRDHDAWRVRGPGGNGRHPAALRPPWRTSDGCEAERIRPISNGDVEPPDPEERHCTGFDVRSSTVRIFRSDGGRRFLRITLRAHSRPFGAWISGVALDTRGGGRVDRIAYLDSRSVPSCRRSEGAGSGGPSPTLSRGGACTGLVPTARSRRAASRWSGWHRRSSAHPVARQHELDITEPVSMVDRAPGAHGWYP